MTQLGLFDVSSTPALQPVDPYAIDHDQIGGAIRPFIRFCKERLDAPEGELSLSLVIQSAWKNRSHPYLKAWDAYQGRQP
ncbi:hypothetical protein NUK34_07925 [Kerstersia gyiorum]|uniref:hypothetical protein n=1 Tax=Kerstersia gyiorum TaxID=206506 RepID=UPI00214FA1A6|nr:hypothetical protein [Kerstersia gyiorum]MCR4158778.1 hypothetical protein [Kerstersia gyiorum]